MEFCSVTGGVCAAVGAAVSGTASVSGGLVSPAVASVATAAVLCWEHSVALTVSLPPQLQPNSIIAKSPAVHSHTNTFFILFP